MAADDRDNVIVTGSSNNGTNSNYYTAKYAAGGALLWEKHGPIGNGSAVAVDGNGNVVVTGSSWSDARADYYTAKYASTDGALLWEKRSNGAANNDAASAVAVDGRGNVVVTGYSYGSNGFSDYYTAKYAAADGALLWDQRYNGPANRDDYAKAVAVDRSGNVIVTGASWNGSNSDYCTFKYAADDGALLWEQRYNGPANGDDQAVAVAMNESGIVVTGSSQNLPSSTPPGNSYSGLDYYTAKYAASDGALLWEKRYNGPANGPDTPSGRRSVALGPKGIVAITGLSSDDYATVVYRENLPPVITCPANTVTNATGSAGAVVNFTVTATDDSGVPPTIVCVLPSGSLFPIGETTVICTATDGDGASSTCSFTATVLAARSIKENVLAELITLRATVTDRNDSRKLDEATSHLTRSVASKLWVDETRLRRRHGRRVFHQEKLTIRKLCLLIRSRTSNLPDAVLQGFIDRIFQADRLLAVVAIEDAITAGESRRKVALAQRFLAHADARVGDDKCYNGIGHYRNAWKRATR